MKFRYSIVVVLMFSVVSIKAQIPNAGFEDWANGDPVGWITLDVLGDAVSQTSDSHSGSSAAKMEIINFLNQPIPPILFSSQVGVTGEYGSLVGYYKFVPQNQNIVFDIAVLMIKDSGYIGGGSLEISQTTSSYTQFVVPLVYFSPEVPDSAYIEFIVADTSEAGIGGIGSYAIIDDLAFSGFTDVQEIQPIISEYKLGQNYPNPFNPTTQINFILPQSGFVSLKVYDIIGNEVATLVNDVKSAGAHSITFNAVDLPSGIYIYKIQSGRFTEAKKMTLLK